LSNFDFVLFIYKSVAYLISVGRGNLIEMSWKSHLQDLLLKMAQTQCSSSILTILLTKAVPVLKVEPPLQIPDPGVEPRTWIMFVCQRNKYGRHSK